MHGSLSLHEGVLWVGRHEKTAHVAAFDLDGRPLGTAFSFRGPEEPRAAASGLVVDRDHRIWVADTPASRLRGFTLFGCEVTGFGGERPEEDHPRELAAPVDVDALTEEGETLLVVASGGRRRHALRIFEPSGELVLSLRPLGDPRGEYRGVTAVAARERMVYAAEAGAARVQVFRDGDFHFAFRPDVPGLGTRPVGLAPLADGRILVAVTGAHDEEVGGLLLFDSTGRPIEVLAGPGRELGEVSEPGGLAVLEGERDRETRVFVLDRDGDRVQVFNLEGVCYGAFESLTG